MIVASVGDLNGDGHADVILGSGFYNAGLGRARVVSGLDGTTLFQLDSTTPYDGLGWSVCGTGDVDGDGVPDFAVGLVDPTGAGAPSAGLVRIYSGKRGSCSTSRWGSPSATSSASRSRALETPTPTASPT